MSRQEKIERARDEIIKATAGRFADIESRLNAVITQFNQIRDEQTAAGDPVGRSQTPGAVIASDHDGLNALLRGGQYAFDLDSSLFRRTPQAQITSTEIGGYGTPGSFGTERGGFLGQLTRPRLVLRNVIPSRSIEEGQFTFIQQQTKADASPQPGEGGDKWQTSISWQAVTSPIRTITSYATCSRQALDDLPELQRIVDNDLMAAVQEDEQTELLSGDGTGDHVNGLINQATSFETARIQTNDSRLDYLRHAVSQLEEADEQPSFICLNPQDFWQIRGLKDQADNAGSYLLPIGAGDSQIWLPVVRTTAMAAGTFLVGSSNRALILDRMTVRVILSFSHGENFTKNLVTAMAESRIGLAVFQSSGFVYGSFDGASPL